MAVKKTELYSSLSLLDEAINLDEIVPVSFVSPAYFFNPD